MCNQMLLIQISSLLISVAPVIISDFSINSTWCWFPVRIRWWCCLHNLPDSRPSLSAFGQLRQIPPLRLSCWPVKRKDTNQAMIFQGPVEILLCIKCTVLVGFLACYCVSVKETNTRGNDSLVRMKTRVYLLFKRTSLNFPTWVFTVRKTAVIIACYQIGK